MIKIKSLFLLTLLTFLFGCKTKEASCDAYSEIMLIQKDTLCIESQHIHIESESLCAYFDDIETVYVDTFYLKIPKQDIK
jgi:hypothetical protein